MTKISNRESQLIEEVKNNNVDQYSILLKTLRPKEVRSVINAGISKIRGFTTNSSTNSKFKRRG